MKPSQVLRNSVKGNSLAEIMLLLEPMTQTDYTNQVVKFIIEGIVKYTTENNVSIKEQNDFARLLIIEAAKRFEKNNN
jgi:hypothetical protein